MTRRTMFSVFCRLAPVGRTWQVPAVAALLVVSATAAPSARAGDVAAGTSAATGGAAVAETEAPVAVAPVAGQRHLGVGPTLGAWSGNGAVVGGGGERVKGWLSGGYFPVLVFANARTADRAIRFNYYTAYQINGDLAVRLVGRPRGELGLLFGYKFNNVLGHGGGLGVNILYDLSRRLGLQILGGVAVFPSAQDRLDRDHGYPADRKPSFPTAVQGGANLGLIFYP